MVTTTKPTLPDIRKRLEAATPGPWKWQDWLFHGNADEGPDKQTLTAPLTSPKKYDWAPDNQSILSLEEQASEGNRELIANAPTDMAHLLSLLDKCKEMIHDFMQFEQRLPADLKIEAEKLLTEIKGNK